MLPDSKIIEQIPRLRRYARALAGERAEAEDLVQDTIERALSRSALFRPGGDARAWLFTILHNLFVNRVRSAAARRTSTLGDAQIETAGRDDSPDGVVVRDIERALALLPEEQRAVVLLVSLEDLSYADVARVIGTPVGTVMSRLARGRERLRELLSAEGTPAALKVIK